MIYKQDKLIKMSQDMQLIDLPLVASLALLGGASLLTVSAVPEQGVLEVSQRGSRGVA